MKKIKQKQLVASVIISTIIILGGLSYLWKNKDVLFKKNEYTVGQIVKQNDVETKVTKVQTSLGEGDNKASEGKEFLVVTVEITNKNDKEIAFNSFNYKLINSKNEASFITATNYSQETKLNGGTVLTNGTRRGDLIYLIDKGSKNYKLGYYNVPTDQEFVYLINVW